MINFRFHLVSLTAVFLALAMGIVMGVTVINEATVDTLEDGIQEAEARADDVRAENDDLRGQLGRWSDFAEQAGDELVEGRLTDVPVVMITVQGTDDSVLSALRGSIAASGAVVGGVVRFTSKFELSEAADAPALAQVLASTDTAPDRLRQTTVDRLATEFGAGSSALLVALEAAGFVDLDGPVDPSSVVTATTRFVVASDSDTKPRNASLATPFTIALARQAPSRVVAVEGSLPDDEERAEEDDVTASRFVRALRDVGDIQISTVDNAADFRGRVATVLALAALGTGEVGDYGFGPGADRLLPELEQ